MKNSLTTEEKIKESLIDQLKAQNKLTEYTEDLVNTYMTHWNIQQMLTEDILRNGPRIIVPTGNGHEKSQDNPSISMHQRETSIMLQILDKLDLKTPVVIGSSKDDYL